MIGWSLSDVAGVNFGDSHIAVARLSGKGESSFTLTHAGWMAYDPGAPEKDVAVVLRKLWRQTGMPTTTVVASLRSASLVMRYFRHPVMPEDELRSALQLQAEECLQMPSDQLVVDWHVNAAPTDGGDLRMNWQAGVLAAAPAKDVERLLKIIVGAGLDPLILDVRAMAMANLYATLGGKREDPTSCVVNLAPHSADVIVLSKTGAVYPHTVFCRASTWAESPAFLCENIRDVMKYSEFKLDWDAVRRVVLTGAIPPGDPFMAAMRERLGLPVERWDPLRHVKLGSKRVIELIDEAPGEAVMLTPSLGLAMRRG